MVTVSVHCPRCHSDEIYRHGLSPTKRERFHIPAKALDQTALDAIHSGDYIGIYSKLNGLDISHVGIAIRVGDQLYYRNASSLQRNRKVVDTPFMDYMHKKPGIVVLRAL